MFRHFLFSIFLLTTVVLSACQQAIDDRYAGLETVDLEEVTVVEFGSEQDGGLTNDLPDNQAQARADVGRPIPRPTRLDQGNEGPQTAASQTTLDSEDGAIDGTLGGQDLAQTPTADQTALQQSQNAESGEGGRASLAGQIDQQVNQNGQIADISGSGQEAGSPELNGQAAQAEAARQARMRPTRLENRQTG